MKPVVLIAPYFPPRRRVGALRPYRFAKYLPEFGYKPIIVHIEDRSSLLTRQEKQALSGCDFISIKPPFDFTTGASGAKRRSSATPKAAAQPPFIDKMMPMDTWWPLLYYKLPEVLHQVCSFSPELIWSTADPWSSNWLGMKLKHSLGLPWVADFRDPWTLCNLRGREKPALTRRLEQRLERRMIKSADLLTFTAMRTTELYHEHYKHLNTPAYTIYNSYDEAAFSSETSVHPPCPPEKLNVFFFGAFRPLSPAKPIIEVLENMHKHFPEQAGMVQIISNAPLNAEDQALAGRAGVSHHFVTAPRVLPEESRAYLQQADVLLLSTSELRDEIIPAKLWDYIAAKRPMLGLSSNPEVHNLLEMHGGEAFSPHHSEAAARALAGYAREKQKRGRCAFTGAINPFTETAAFTSQETTRNLARLFDTLRNRDKSAAAS